MFTSLSQFLILDEVQRSVSGAVFHVKHKETGKEYALKERKDSEMGIKKDVLNEVKLLSVVKHPNVVNCAGHFLENGLLYIVLEWSDCGDLQVMINDRKKRGEPWNEIEIWRFFLQILRGLLCLHAKEIVHRDLKPLNILVSSSRNNDKKNGFTLKLADFGVSRMRSKETIMLSTFYGTPLYASPELCENKPYNEKTDIWSLGVILYELAALKTPFSGESLMGLAKNITEGKFSSLPFNYSPLMSTVIKKLLQVNPERRPTAFELFEWFIDDHVYNPDEIKSFQMKIKRENEKSEGKVEIKNGKVEINNDVIENFGLQSNQGIKNMSIQLGKPQNLALIEKDNDDSISTLKKSTKINYKKLDNVSDDEEKLITNINVKKKKTIIYEGEDNKPTHLDLSVNPENEKLVILKNQSVKIRKDDLENISLKSENFNSIIELKSNKIEEKCNDIDYNKTQEILFNLKKEDEKCKRKNELIAQDVNEKQVLAQVNLKDSKREKVSYEIVDNSLKEKNDPILIYKKKDVYSPIRKELSKRELMLQKRFEERKTKIELENNKKEKKVVNQSKTSKEILLEHVNVKEMEKEKFKESNLERIVQNFGMVELQKANEKFKNLPDLNNSQEDEEFIAHNDFATNPNKAKARRLLMQRVIFGGLDATPMAPDLFGLHDAQLGSLKLRRKKYNIINGKWL